MRTGRPSYDTSLAEIQELIENKFSVPQIADLLGVSVSTVRRRMKSSGLTIKSTYSEDSMETLVDRIRMIHLDMPNIGMKLMKGMLWSRFKIRVAEGKLRDAVRLADPIGVAIRKAANRTINRRAYHVEFFKSLWHLDTNMKLTRYKIVIQSCIDGKSRLCTYITVKDNNTALTSLSSFMEGVRRYGMPTRTRSDRGGECILIARFMIVVRGTNRSSHITGRSVHNQRIERFWGDLYRVTGFFYETFNELENDGLLDVENQLLLWILHFVYLPRMNKVVEDFRTGWNDHPLSTERNLSPTQLAILYPDPDNHEVPTDILERAYEEILGEYGMEDQMPVDTIRNPQRLVVNLQRQTLERLQLVDVGRLSTENGKDVYLECLEILREFGPAPQNVNILRSSATETNATTPSHPVSEEVRRLFQPYNRDIGNSGCVSSSHARALARRNSQFSQRRGSALANHSRSRTVQRTWRRKIVFLGDPNETTRPTSERLDQLNHLGLGNAVMSCGIPGMYADFVAAVKRSFETHVASFFPGVALDMIEFTLFYTRGSGSWNLVEFRRTYTMEDISELNPHTVYAVPSITLCALEQSEDETEDVGSASTASPPSFVASSETVSIVNVAATTEASNEGSSTDPIVQSEGVASTSDTVEIYQSIPSTSMAGFQYNYNIEVTGTLEQMRQQIRYINPETQVIQVPQLNSDHIFPTELIRFRQEISPLRRTEIEISGETTVDTGGPLRSYIWKVMESIRNKPLLGVPFLDGEDGSFFVSSDVCFRRQGLMEAFANFLNFSIINTGVGFVGLSKNLVEFICSSGMPNKLSMSSDEIPDFEARTAVKILKDWQSSESDSISSHQKEIVQSALRNADWFGDISKLDAQAAMDHIIDRLVTSRMQSLELLRREFLRHPLGRWVACNPQEINTVFPQSVDLNLDWRTFIGAFQQNSLNHVYIRAIENYVQYFMQSGRKLSLLVELICGFPQIPDSGMCLSVDENIRFFEARTCSNELVIFPVEDQELFNENMEILLANGQHGFLRI